MPTPILQLPLVAPNQNQKETTINSALAILEAASNDARIIDGAGNPAIITLGDVNFTRWLMQKVQNHTGAISVKVPALKRFFVVSNEGTGAVTFYPDGGTAMANGAAVPAGKIVLLMSDGTNVRALSSGVSKLMDLTDVDPTDAAEGLVLTYDATAEKWVPATVAEIVAVAFTDLTDTPNAYTGQAGKLVTVAGDADGLEFKAPADFGFATQFTDLEDVPSAYTGKAGFVVVVNATSDGLDFVEIETGGGGAATFLELSDTPNDYTDDANKKLRVNAGSTAVEFVSDTFLSQNDTPDVYTGQGGKKVRVKTDASGLEFATDEIGVIAAKTGDYTAVLSDANQIIPFNIAGPQNFTIPANASVAFPVGTQLSAMQIASAQVTIVADGGVTLNYPSAGLPKTREQWSTIMAVKIATNTWVVLGDMEAAA